MTNNNQETILVYTSDTSVRGVRYPEELPVNILAENVNVFLMEIEKIMKTTPDVVGPFRLSKFIISAEVSADGKLILLGSGVEAGVKGGLTFEFERKT